MNNFNDVPVLEHEYYFGFHSENYIDLCWRKSGSKCDKAETKGYPSYAAYKDDIYCFSDTSEFLIKINIKTKKSCVIKLKPGYSNLAVNRHGYFLYTDSKITLFGFDGMEIYTHKFSTQNNKECIYIYDDKVYYSETTSKSLSNKIICVNMYNGSQRIVWSTQKGDAQFDYAIEKSYELLNGKKLPFNAKPSQMANISCEFLYANSKRVVAGYTRMKHPNQMSYIINIDLLEHKWSILEINAYKNTYCNDNLSPQRIFSFDMLNDTMWVKEQGDNINLFHTGIKPLTKLNQYNSVEWKLRKTESYSEYYYFDGNKAFILERMALIELKRDGSSKDVYYHDYQTYHFFCYNDIYIIPEFSSVTVKSINKKGDIIYQIVKWEIEEMIQQAKNLQSENKQSPPLKDNISSDDENVERSVRKVCEGIFEKFAKRYNINYTKDDINNFVEISIKTFRHFTEKDSQCDTKDLMENFAKTIAQKASTIVEWISQKEQKTVQKISSHQTLEDKITKNYENNNGISLVDFRKNAPFKKGYREELLSYRKELPNSWDYNAFVGILLGIGGPKHGDAACLNFAIGQGDNRNNTKKILSEKGLMNVFEKYKGKKIDSSITLIEVENEIISIVPEFEQIRQAFHSIIKE